MVIFAVFCFLLLLLSASVMGVVVVVEVVEVEVVEHVHHVRTWLQGTWSSMTDNVTHPSHAACDEPPCFHMHRWAVRLLSCIYRTVLLLECLSP